MAQIDAENPGHHMKSLVPAASLNSEQESELPQGPAKLGWRDLWGGEFSLFHLGILVCGVIATVPDLIPMIFNIDKGSVPQVVVTAAGSLGVVSFTNLHQAYVKNRQTNKHEKTFRARINKLEEESQRLAQHSTTMYRAVEAAIPDLYRIANMSPDDRDCLMYVKQVMESFRQLLEPKESNDDCVRICLYRISAAEGSGNDEEIRFTSYATVKGSRKNHPRECFSTKTKPGAEFMDDLLRTKRYEQSGIEIEADDPYYSNGRQPEYSSFVNILVEDENGNPLAMLTADSKYESFFNEERNRLIEILGMIASVALFSEIDEKSPF